MMSLPLALTLLGAQAPMTLSIDLAHPGHAVGPSLYGIFFEEINQAGDGGIYGEMLQNRGLEAVPNDLGRLPGWRLDSGVTVAAEGPNSAHSHSLALPSGAKVTNSGWNGLAIKAGATYRLTAWVKGRVTLQLGDAGITLGSSGSNWHQLEARLVPGRSEEKGAFSVIAVDGPASVAYASVMPEQLWKGRKNGLRKDLAETVDAIHPAFVRFPGGCFVEGGDRFTDAFDWKASVGPVEERKGLAHSMWGYPVTYGLGYHEYLQWCEDMKSTPLFVVNCGINHRQLWPMNDMRHWIDYTLDAIEYANGPVTSKWGALRANNGHPKPFGLKYIEIGNENGGWFFGGNKEYEPRYRLIYDAIKAKYPNIVTIADWSVNQPMDTVDEHYYEDPSWFWKNANRYDTYDRKGPKIYVGEYAVTKGCGQGNLAAAIGEAAFMTGMERNSDVVAMSSYAPLFVNVANKQWNPDAIVFNANQAYGTPSYHVQAMFSNNRADRIVPMTFPVLTSAPPAPGGEVGLETWGTQAEFRDIQLTVDGKTTNVDGYARDVKRGDWKESNGVLRQSSLDTDRVMLFKGSDTGKSSHYTLSLKARKISGKEGFIIRFDEHDDQWIQWNLGGWGNTDTAFQRNGTIVSNRVPLPIETDRWYDIRIERDGSTVRGYLDGKLIQEFHEEGTPDFTAVAGIDDRTKELVIKVVNGSDEGRIANLDLHGRSVAATGKALTLTAPTLFTENTFANPTAVAPVKSSFAGTTYAFSPRSVTILRLRLK